MNRSVDKKFTGGYSDYQLLIRVILQEKMINILAALASPTLAFAIFHSLI